MEILLFCLKWHPAEVVAITFSEPWISTTEREARLTSAHMMGVQSSRRVAHLVLPLPIDVSHSCRVVQLDKHTTPPDTVEESYSFPDSYEFIRI